MRVRREVFQTGDESIFAARRAAVGGLTCHTLNAMRSRDKIVLRLQINTLHLS